MKEVGPKPTLLDVPVRMNVDYADQSPEPINPNTVVVQGATNEVAEEEKKDDPEYSGISSSSSFTSIEANESNREQGEVNRELDEGFEDPGEQNKQQNNDINVTLSSENSIPDLQEGSSQDTGDQHPASLSAKKIFRPKCTIQLGLNSRFKYFR